MRCHKKHLILTTSVVCVVFLDQITKMSIVEKLKLGQEIVIFEDFFRLALVYNAGAAFGLLANLDPSIRQPFFIIIPSLTLAFILYAYYQLKKKQWCNMVGIALIIGGAIGNLIDRFRLGYVIDFLDFHWFNKHHFPTFNIADSAITTGVFFLILGIFLHPEESPKKAP